MTGWDSYVRKSGLTGRTFKRPRVVLSKRVVDGTEAKKDSLATSAPKTFFVLNFRKRVTIVTCPHLVVSLSDC